MTEPVAFTCMRHVGIFAYSDYHTHMDELHDGHSDCVGTIATFEQVVRMLSGESYSAVCCTRNDPPVENHIVEVFTMNHGPRLGQIANIEKRRVVALVSHKEVGSDNLWVLYTADGDRMVINAPHTEYRDLGPAPQRGGWINW